jgi:DNA-binding transcriptional ArsR family regulator
VGRPRQDGGPDLFGALADPTRRRVLERLAEREHTVSELVAGLEISQAAVSQHLKVLRETGLAEARSEGRHRFYRLRPEGLTELSHWLAELERFWRRRVAALGTYLDDLEGDPS